MNNQQLATSKTKLIVLITMSVIAIPVMIILINHPLATLTSSHAAMDENSVTLANDLTERMQSIHPQIPISHGEKYVSEQTDSSHTLRIVLSPIQNKLQNPLTLTYFYSGGNNEELKAMNCRIFNESDTLEKQGQNLTSVSFQQNKFLINGAVTFSISPSLISQKWVVQCIGFWKNPILNTSGNNTEWIFQG